MSTPIVEMKNITKEFPGINALNNVGFRVAQGEIHYMVGENGAGKSTLMKVLIGVYPYKEYSGDILFGGETQIYIVPQVRFLVNCPLRKQPKKRLCTWLRTEEVQDVCYQETTRNGGGYGC